MLGKIHQALNNKLIAIESFEKAIEIKPSYFEAFYNLGISYSSIGKNAAAHGAYSKAIELNPNFAEAYNNLALYWSKVGDYTEALINFSEVLRINPNLPETYNNIATIFIKINRLNDAIEMLQKALDIKPFYADAHNNLGNILKTLGLFREATGSYKMALESKPLFTEAMFNLVQINQVPKGDPIQKVMEDRLKDSKISQNDRMLLSFSLGKVFDDADEPNIAYAYFKEGNDIHKSLTNYALKQDTDLVVRLKSYFSTCFSGYAEEYQLVERKKEIPIFIVGMPRSGTTLVEQILSSHANVYGAGELTILGDLANGIDFRELNQYEKLVTNIREPYLAYLDRLGKTGKHVVDKMPLNFFWVGLIIQALPEAKIVHVSRDARATCWSIFKHLFQDSGSDFGYSFDDLIGFYKLYVDLMKFWHQRFPNKIYDLDYDYLTTEQELSTRALLEYLDLEFSRACLDFHKTNREVKTASTKQVRQKMYQGSSNRWLKYKPYLPLLVEGLKHL
tara:strand:- start:61 stop:1578 length:1518 start_codon:yes stop_codon:yes gene_type:complete